MHVFLVMAALATAVSLGSAASYKSADIGTATNGTLAVVEGGFDVAGSGSDIGGTGDHFQFSYQELEGNFDLRVKVATLSLSDPYVQAGLMARESLEPGSKFAGSFASSVLLGSFLESRNVTGARTASAAPLGGFPANFPDAWLRLQRSGNQFVAFGGFDGRAWQRLGSVTIEMPEKLLLGFAVSSHASNSLARASFRDFGVVAAPEEFEYKPQREPMGPSNRRTGMIISEMMYHPMNRADGLELEFVEVFNAESIFLDLSGWKLDGAIEFVFPPGFILQAGEFAVIAADPESMRSVYRLQNVLGPYAGRLNNAGDRLRLLNKAGATRLEVEYAPNSPWPSAADGAGHSLVLSHASYGENDSRAWSASSRKGGSPGTIDPLAARALDEVVINEFLAHTDAPVLDFVELHNPSASEVDLSGCILTDDATTNRFRIPSGTRLPGRGFIVFDQIQLGFALSSAGETIYLMASDGSRVLDAIRFEGQENGVSSGRAADGSPVIRRLATPTPGTRNSTWRSERVVISEIMYRPPSLEEADQYVEIHNTTAEAVDLSGWSFTAGIEFKFPAGASIPGGGFAVAGRDPERLRANYPQLTPANTFGGFRGALRASGEGIALAMPDSIIGTNTAGATTTNTIRIVVSEVAYFDGGRWPELADGGGSSLELVDTHADIRLPDNWAASDESAKAPWTKVDFTGKVEFGLTSPTMRRFYISMLGAGECLIDDLEVIQFGSTNILSNGGFESGMTGWQLFGNHRGSGLDTSGANTGSGVLHVRAPGDGDTGNNAVRGTMGVTIANNQTVTIRANVRWLSGWPEVLLRVRGNGIEVPVRMEVPANLGTPGQANSRRRSNRGPAIFDVAHSPALPQVNEPVVVTCRVSDPDGTAAPRLRWRVDPNQTLANVVMHDDGLNGDAAAGDGLYSTLLPGRASGNLVAFRIECSDDAAAVAASVFPSDAPARECLIRWGDAIPHGTLAHYHMWSTAATEGARGSSPDLDNTFRDCTLVYGNFRVIYNARFRDKGSPYHGGGGDFAVAAPRDSMLLGIDDRVFGSTGNGGPEPTGMAGDVANWIAEQMGLPFLHSHYMRLYRNGTSFRNVMYDLEQPNGYYARSWYGGGGIGDDLYKIAIWFEFDEGGNFTPTGASFQAFRSGNNLKLSRYRWNWQQRPTRTTVSDYRTVFNLIDAANSTAQQVTGLMNLADMQEWMGVFAFNRIVGNWDSWTFNLGQNMFLYVPLGQRAVLMPWDVDFVLGEGNGISDPLWGGHDNVMNTLIGLPTYRRMLWRAYQDAVNGPMTTAQYDPQINARRSILLQNGISGLSDPRGIKTYIQGRRNYIIGQLNRVDIQPFTVIPTNATEITSQRSTATLTGTAPIAAAEIRVNGVPYPVTWTALLNWRIEVPLGAARNELRLTAHNLRGQPLAGADKSLTVLFSGDLPQPQDWIVINEIMYRPLQENSGFIEVHNRHPNAAFDLSGYRLNGADFTFPSGSVIPANGFAVIAKDRAGFASVYGATIAVLGEYSGRLENGGETLRLIKPGQNGTADVVTDEVRYDSAWPWPSTADGGGASLQLIDAAQDNWRVGNWAATSTNDVNRATPGRANATRAVLEPYAPLWINEVLPANVRGATDASGRPKPWIEIYNAGKAPVDLSGFSLGNQAANSSANIAPWQIPAGTSVGAGQFLGVWADGQPGLSTSSEFHANFELDPTQGAVFLSRMQQGAPAIVDYVEYKVAASDQSFGSFPDGDPRKRRLLFTPTFAAANDPSTPQLTVTINEWMGSNRSILADPADGDFEDWFEVHNAGTNQVDLSGYFLSDNLANSTRFQIPVGVSIPPRGFRLFWADDETSQNAAGRDLHVNFRLSADGGQLALFSPDGLLVDGVTFGAQTADVSEGRTPDGGAAPFDPFAIATPGAPNAADSLNRAPVLAPISNVSVGEGTAVSFRAAATDTDVPAQTITFALLNAPAGAVIDPATGQFHWTPGEAQGPRVHIVTLVASDNGTPRRSVLRTLTVTVAEVNQAPALAPIEDILSEEGSLITFRAVAEDADEPAQALAFSLDPSAPAGAAIDSISGEFRWVPAEDQGPAVHLITVRVTDNQTPALSANRSFRVTVPETDNPPVITPIGPQVVQEGAVLRVPIQAFDPDPNPDGLVYSLENSPAGAVIDAATGVLSWTPGEADGPRDHNVTVRVTESSGGGIISSATSFLVGVREVNSQPVLEAIADSEVGPGQTLRYQILARDADLPEQHLSFRILTALPEGAQLDETTGVFAWTIPEDPLAGLREIRIQVLDDGTPRLSAERSFRVNVFAPPRVVINEILHWPSKPNAAFVELHNHSRVNSIEVGGWRLEGYDFRFAAGTMIPPAGFLCVASDLAEFRATFGERPAAVGNAIISVPTAGGSLRLVRATATGDEVIHELSFSAQPPWPAESSFRGASLQLRDPRADARQPANWSASVGLVTNAPSLHIPMLAAWKYRQDTTAPAANWNLPEFDDRSWRSGGALLYVETAALPAAKTTPLTLGAISYYFRANFGLDSSPEGARFALNVIVDDGAVVYLNGVELYRIGMPAGAITASTFASRTVGDAVAEGPFEGVASGLRLGTNTLAVEVHQPNASSSDIVFGASLELTTLSAAAFTPGAPNQISKYVPPMLTATLDSVGRARVTWTAQIGFKYRVESSSSLVNPAWTPVYEVTATGPQDKFIDINPLGSSPRYYRVRVE